MIVSKSTFDSENDVSSAYGSAEQRQHLFWRSLEVTLEHPLFGVGPGNFPIISDSWLVTHNSYTQMSSEGGIPALVLYVMVLWAGFKNLKKLGSCRVLIKKPSSLPVHCMPAWPGS